MFEKRLRAYRALGYACEDTPIDCSVSSQEPVVECDRDSIWSADEIT
jgi:hypothetical protein